MASRSREPERRGTTETTRVWKIETTVVEHDVRARQRARIRVGKDALQDLHELLLATARRTGVAVREAFDQLVADHERDRLVARDEPPACARAAHRLDQPPGLRDPEHQLVV